MKVVVIGGTGLIGSKVVAELRTRGHEAVPAAPDTGVDTLTGDGLADALEGASAVVDVANAPSFDDTAVMDFFETSTRNVLAAGVDAGVAHHVALSVVGSERLVDSGYMRAKVVQEKLIRTSPMPYSIVRATQFFEFAGRIADGATVDGTVHLPSVLFQPIASDDVAGAVANVVMGAPHNNVVEIAGPELGTTSFADWLARSTTGRGPTPAGTRDRQFDIGEGRSNRLRRRSSEHNAGMLLAEVVAVSESVAATRSRTAKIDALAALLRRLDPDEISVAVGFLVGTVRPGRVGIGWATLRAIDVPAATEPSLSVLDVDQLVADLAGTTGAGSVAARRALLGTLFGRATEAEAGFLNRLLLGELRQGALQGVMTDAIARAADVPLADVRRAAMLGGDLCVTAHLALTGGAGALADVHLEVMQPVQPMLAATAESVADALAATGPASVEWKLDGARIQVHRAGDEVRVFTRNLNDVTDRLPDVVAAGRLLGPRELVLDGEVIGLGDDERPQRFQDTMSRFGRQRLDEHGIPLTALFFDCLRVDGDDLIARSLSERIDVLTSFAGDRRIPGTRTADVAEAERVLEEALANGHEGVMVKALDSVYDAGRRGAAWRKVKPVHTVDLVVLAVEWGSGRRQGWLSNLHLGARGPDGGFVMVGKTFKGLTDELLAWQTEAFLEREVRREGHTVFVRPELVVEIAVDGAQVSPRYPGGVALRFARVKRYRQDKSAAEADTIDAVRRIFS